MSQFLSISALAQTVYRRQRDEAHSKRWGAIVPETIPLVESAPLKTWSERKLCAILQCHRSDASKDCVRHFAAAGVRGRQEDFAELRREGFAVKRELARFHELTPMGKREAVEAALIVARKFGLHHITRNDGSQNASAKCTCGRSWSFGRKYGNENAHLDRAINTHLADPVADDARRTAAQAQVQEVLDSIGRRFGDTA